MVEVLIVSPCIDPYCSGVSYGIYLTQAPTAALSVTIISRNLYVDVRLVFIIHNYEITIATETAAVRSVHQRKGHNLHHRFREKR